MAEILVAGGSGFIGSHLAQRLSGQDHSVTVLTTGAPRSNTVLFSPVTRLQVDLRDQAAVNNELKGKRYQKIFNLSGYIDHTPFFKGGRSVLAQHFDAIQNLLEAVDRSVLEAYVQIGSSDEYGNAPSPQQEDVRESPIAPYSLGKVAATHFLQMLHKTENFPATIVRFFLVYGPGQDDKRFIPQIVKGCLEKKKFNASEGRQLRDFCYVDDIVEGLLLAAEKKEARGHVINLASGQPVAIRSVVESVVKICGGGEPVFGAVPYRAGENMSLYANVSKAKQLLGWTPSTNLETGLKKTVTYYSNAALIKSK